MSNKKDNIINSIISVGPSKPIKITADSKGIWRRIEWPVYNKNTGRFELVKGGKKI